MTKPDTVSTPSQLLDMETRVRELYEQHHKASREYLEAAHRKFQPGMTVIPLTVKFQAEWEEGVVVEYVTTIPDIMVRLTKRRGGDKPPNSITFYDAQPYEIELKELMPTQEPPQ